MENQRNVYNFTNLTETFFVENRCSHIETMCSSDCNCKRCNSCTLYEFFCFLWICVGVCLCFQIIFFTADLTKFCFAWNIKCFCYICHTFGLCDVCFKIQFGSIDHNRSISCMYCLHSKLKTAAMIQMKAYRNRCFLCFCCNDCRIGIYGTVFNCRWCSLDHNRRFEFFCSLDDCFDHLHVLCVKCTYCITAFLSFGQHFF